MSNTNNKELKLYEALGVKNFKRFVLSLRELPLLIGRKGKSKEEIREMIRNTASNYTVGNLTLDGFKKFKKQLYFNAGVHVFALSLCIPNTINTLNGTASTVTAAINIGLIVLNIYCIMLQRYNYIRIKPVIDRLEKREAARKAPLVEELTKEDALLPDHKYTIVDYMKKKKKEKTITFEEFLNMASEKDLKEYHKQLEYYKYSVEIAKKYGIYRESEDLGLSLLMGNMKKLKMDLNYDKGISK